MTREERKIYQIGVLVAAALIIAMTAVVTEECSAKMAVYAAPALQTEDFIEETTGEPEKGQIRATSAMPCDDPEAFRKWLATYEEETDEQETGEEAPAETTGESRMDSDAADQADATDPESARSNTSAEEMENEAPGSIYYRIAGELIDPDIQRTIYKALEAEDLTDWYTGALAQCFQESRGDRFAVSKNGLDMGIFQYREPFWNYYSNGDIFDPEAQAILYAKEMARRFNAGLSVDEAISRHYTSDYHTEVDWEYVGQVRQWLGQMEAIK